MQLKLGKHVYPVKGLLTVFGATLLLISMAVDFSYGKLTFSYLYFHHGTKYIIRLDIMAYPTPKPRSNSTKVE